MQSILQHDTAKCALCGRRGTVLDKHHVFFGRGNRPKSERYGLTVYLCHDSCHIFGPRAVHVNHDICLLLQQKAQRAAMKYYYWTVGDFQKIFGKNYL